jgi:RimJ/RimL family protein N-acetyltransferase
MLNVANRPVLTSPRLILRPPRKDDASAIATLANDWEVARRLTRLPHPYTLQDALFFLEEIVPKELVWSIESRSSRTLIGVIGLTPDENAGTLELGYWLGRPFWGHGFATQAAGLVIDYALARDAASLITAGCFTDNFRSLRVLHKLGFAIKGQSLRFCMAEQRELPHYDLLLTRAARL